MGSETDADAVRRRVEGWRAASRREREVRRQEAALDPETSLSAAIELSALLPSAAEDPVRKREIEQTRRVWARLRAHYKCLPSDRVR